jgi:hypothetical protein
MARAATPRKRANGTVTGAEKKTGRGTISSAGQPSSTRGLTTRMRRTELLGYIREPVNVAAASGAGVFE